MKTLRVRILGECRIETDGESLTPDSPYVFALMLYATSKGAGKCTRSELLEMLFPHVHSKEQASHNLRQLLYRLRRIGAPLTLHGSTVALHGVELEGPLARLTQLTTAIRAATPAKHWEVLPGYAPELSRHFSEWVEDYRTHLTAQVRTVLFADLDFARRNCEWNLVVALGRTLCELRLATSHTQAAHAEGLYMLGHRTEALSALDESHADFGSNAPTNEVVTLRRRILRGRSGDVPANPPMVGREELLASVTSAWVGSSEKGARLELLAGPPGIGKSRVLTELSNFVTLKGGQTLPYNCDASDIMRPHSLFRALVPHLRAMRGSLGASPELRDHLALLDVDGLASQLLDPAIAEATRSNIQLALVDLVQAVASEKPLLLTVDDAHFLDETSWATLRAIRDQGADGGVMIVCAVRAFESSQLSDPTHRPDAVHWLTPLSTSESRQLLTTLLSSPALESAHLEWCIQQAAGNPFYLHALARHGADYRATGKVPFDIRSLAASSYLSLDSDSRALLDTCLHLGRFASLSRVQEVAAIEGRDLLRALRRLEDMGMLTFAGGTLRCVHALLEDALLMLVPSAVSAAVHAKVASCLEKELGADGLPAENAWAAADHWLRSGNPTRATSLVRRSASQMARLGEAQAAAVTLARVTGLPLSAEQLAPALDDLIEYANAAGDNDLLCSGLSERRRVSADLHAPYMELRRLEMRLHEARLQGGADPAPLLNSLTSIAIDRACDHDTRAGAVIRLLMAADMMLDRVLAVRAQECLESLCAEHKSRDANVRRAELVYHTVFGNQDIALDLARELHAEHSEPALSRDTVAARHNAAFALSRMGHWDEARPILVANYHLMTERRVHGEALYNATLLCENACQSGRLDDARHWLEAVRDRVTHKEPRARYNSAAYFAVASSVALMTGDLDLAQECVAKTDLGASAGRTPRLKAVRFALMARVAARTGTLALEEDVVSMLRQLYEKGAQLGGQDTIVEALWLAHQSDGDAEAGSQLLKRYLLCDRRENTVPEWSLRFNTRHDSAWLASRWKA